MKRKLTVSSGVLLLCFGTVCCLPGPGPRGRLLKVPKVYNALITSNEPLLPSRTEQATVGQVLYYPPVPAGQTYPASSGPLILPQVAAQSPPLYDPSQPFAPLPQQQHLQQQQQQPYQPFVSLPQQQQQDEPSAPPLELNIQPQLSAQEATGPQDQSTPWPIVYASDDRQQQQQQQQQPGRYPVGGRSPNQSELPTSAFPAARAIQRVEHVAELGEYQPPPAVDIDSVKNNRPSGIPDVPPPPLPVGRKNHQPAQGLPPGILPF